jgi:subtilisin family serine protease
VYYDRLTMLLQIQVPREERNQIMEQLPKQITDISFLVFPEGLMGDAASRYNDPVFRSPDCSWYFEPIQAYDAWEITKGKSDVVVAIVDSYFDLSNPEIGERFRDPINIATKKKFVLPPAQRPANVDIDGVYSHGSHVAGIAIGGQGNGLGCSGIAPKCKWIPVALGASPWSSVTVIEGVLYAIYHGADVVNMSIGSVPSDMGKLPLADQVALATKMGIRGEKAWEFILKTAEKHNCVIVKAAGNETALMGIDYKNRSKKIINVEAVDGKGQATDFSNFGRVPEAGLDYSTVAAPGLMLWSVAPKNSIPVFAKFFKSKGINLPTDAKTGFMPMQGTSMACPVVTGAVALLKSKKKDLTTDQVIKILTMTAKQTDTKHRIGPTIQIKDALNMTGGELANFDDLMKNHDLLIGKWKSTYELNIVNSKGQRIDDMWTYFIFPSPSAGTLEDHGINTKRIYKAAVNVEWRKDCIIFHQPQDAVSADGDTMNKDEFVCKPNKDRLLEVSVQRNGKERYTFQLEKVN